MDDHQNTSTTEEMITATADAEAVRRLVTDVRRGDRPAADQLVRQHDRWVRSVIFGVVGRADLVDDIAQQVWTQVWERLDSLQDPARLRSWLYSVARNAAIDMSMARGRQRELGEASGDAIVAAPDRPEAGPLRRVLHGELRTTLLRAVESLPALYREPFVLRHLEGWSYKEIGELLGLGEETVETRLVRARRLLREALAGKID